MTKEQLIILENSGANINKLCEKLSIMLFMDSDDDIHNINMGDATTLTINAEPMREMLDRQLSIELDKINKIWVEME